VTAGDPDLVANLENRLPAELPVGTGTAVFCYGTCFHRHEPIENLELVVDGVHRHRPAAFGMPRPDISPHRSGFWATVPIEPHDRPGAVKVAVAARLASGEERVAPLGRIPVARPDPAPVYPGVPDPPLIAICMATYEPDIRLFHAQIESLRAQTDDHWICLISDDCSSPERFEQMLEVLADDRRFVVSRSEERLRFYRNFERALRMAPAEAELLALCDQDDRWHPSKLEVLRGALGGAQLVYSDQRLVDAGGHMLRPTMWKRRCNNHTNLASLLVANTVTGAATLFRREVAELALPFPETPGMQFHDHWLGLVALASGDVAYVERPLYDYVQHRGAVFGNLDTGGPRGLSLRGGRGAYFLGYLPREVQAQALLVRCAGRLTASKRRALARYGASARSPAALLWLTLRSLRAVVGRNETLGTELELVRGVLWRWAIGLTPRSGRPWLDARYPDPTSFEHRRLRRWRARI
jgi:glycosyltransferase involved in cell wall biosynthesis